MKPGTLGVLSALQDEFAKFGITRDRYAVVTGGKHIHVRLDGALIYVFSRSMRDWGRTRVNTVCGLRRALRQKQAELA